MYVHYFNDSLSFFSFFFPLTHASDIKTDNEENNGNDNGNDIHDDSSGLRRKCEGQHRWGTWVLLLPPFVFLGNCRKTFTAKRGDFGGRYNLNDRRVLCVTRSKVVAPMLPKIL